MISRSCPRRLPRAGHVAPARAARPATLAARMVAGDEAGAWGIVEGRARLGCRPGRRLPRHPRSRARVRGRRLGGRHDLGGGRAPGNDGGAAAIGRLGPRFTRRGRKRGAVVLGAPPGEQHSLPTAIVGDLLRGVGFEVLDLGANAPAESFAETARAASRVVAVGIAATTPGHDAAVRSAVRALRRAGVTAPLLVGGAAVTGDDHARWLGADGWSGPDARSAVAAVEQRRPRRPRRGELTWAPRSCSSIGISVSPTTRRSAGPPPPAPSSRSSCSTRTCCARGAQPRAIPARVARRPSPLAALAGRRSGRAGGRHRHGDQYAVVHAVGASAVAASADVSALAQRRQRALADACAHAAVTFELHPGVTIVQPGELLPAGGGGHFRVFTPYWRKWSSATWSTLRAAPSRLALPSGVDVGLLPSFATLAAGTCSPDVVTGGERAGLRRLDVWLDAPSTGPWDTSRLSPYLRFGCLSPLEVARSSPPAGGKGRTTSCVSCAGGTSFTKWRPTSPPSPTPTTDLGLTAPGGRTRPRFRGPMASPGCPLWTRGCANCGARGGCRTGRGCWPRRT